MINFLEENLDSELIIALSAIGNWVAAIVSIGMFVIAIWWIRRSKQVKLSIDLVCKRSEDRKKIDSMYIQLINMGQSPIAVNQVYYSIGKSKKWHMPIDFYSYFQSQIDPVLKYGDKLIVPKDLHEQTRLARHILLFLSAFQQKPNSIQFYAVTASGRIIKSRIKKEIANMLTPFKFRN